MSKQTFRFFLATLTILGLISGGNVQAYLSPINQAAVDAGVIPGTNDDPTFVISPGHLPDYLTTANWAYSPPLRKFLDTLPPLGCDQSNNLGQCIPVAVPDIVSFPGSDYYEIELLEFEEQMHSDLANPTTIRGYRQINAGTDTAACSDPLLGQPDACTETNNTDLTAVNAGAHYLGPIIVSQKDRPVRVKFVNSLPTGSGGELFVPVDESIMGAGRYEIDYDPNTKEPMATTQGLFAQNRGELHLHGGRTPWISDGTPHQWITPAGEDPVYPKGVSVVNVPDMDDPGPGAQTYYWTNQQSARMMFYHDHAWGITRLNVYVGEAAGYLVRDATEQSLIDSGFLPVDEIPLVIQDKSYVDASTVLETDPTWRWGTGTVSGTIQENGREVNVHEPKTGDFWWPHVYMPAQNPFDITGIAPMGRWAYGPYFWPPTNNEFQPVPNPYYNPDCDPNGDPVTMAGLFGGFCQPPEIPGTPNPSWGAEAFMDTPIVNGTAYPTVTLEPKAYRLRILNAAHDRFFNLSFFAADTTVDPNVANPACSGTCATETEVRMVPAADYSADPTWPDTWPADGRDGGIPDWNLAGPDWVMIGSEGGFLPQPVVIPAHPVDWNADVTTFNAGNVNKGSLILGPAERADVVVDFSQYDGQTLILYNDAPAPWPALDFHYDYYTGAPDNTAAGGYGPIAAGIGPNTRTIMQIKVQGTPAPAYDTASLIDAFTSQPGQPSVFEQGQDPLIVGQGNMNPNADPLYYEAFPFGQDYSALNKAYDNTFPTTYPRWGVARIYDQSLTFVDPTTFDPANPAASEMTVPMKFKAIQDEQGETFDMYGRMRAGLGLEFADPGAGQVNFVIQTYSDPPTEILNPDEIQIWKITHNGVDTHPIHFHLYDVQVINRVGWDGFMRLPDPTELGWKDTIRISPLEDTIVALKPVTPRVPFGVPESYRPKNPATPLGDTTELSLVDPVTADAWLTPNVNEFLNLDWEYVWHCHILSHEENDMMRSQSFQFVENLPDAPTNVIATENGAQVDLTWVDPTPVDYVSLNNFGNPTNEIGFRIERSVNGGPFTFVANALANATGYSDTTVSAGVSYNYRVSGYNAAGDSNWAETSITTTFRVFTPNGGEALTNGQTFNVQWTAYPGTAFYRLRYSVDGGTNWLFIDRVDGATNYNWTVPNADSANVLFRVTAHGAGGGFLIRDESDAPFTIIPGSTLIQPNGGELLTVGQNYDVQWTAFPGAAFYRLRYSVDGGMNWLFIGRVDGATSYNWTVPVENSANVLFRVTAHGAGGGYLARDESDASFTIGAALLQPNGGEVLTVGQNFNVQWTAFSGTAFYRLRYSVDGGTNWLFIDRVDGATSYNWTVPNENSANVLFRVTAHGPGGGFLDRDESDASFTIAP